MRRAYSLVLLLALMSTPLTAMGGALFSSCASCCCSGTLCPMHKKVASFSVRAKLGKPTAIRSNQLRSSSPCAAHFNATIMRLLFPLRIHVRASSSHDCKSFPVLVTTSCPCLTPRRLRMALANSLRTPLRPFMMMTSKQL